MPSPIPHHPLLFPFKQVLCLHEGKGSLRLSGPTGKATNWILPGICDEEGEDLPQTAATRSVPSLLLVTASHSQQRRGLLQPLLAMEKLPTPPWRLLLMDDGSPVGTLGL